MPRITLEEVTKFVNNTPVVNDVNLEIPDKSLYCIIGPPRSGKSMLMRIISGLEAPDKGKVLFDGRDVGGLGPYERRVAVVFQDFALYPHLTAFENIASPLKKLKLPKEEIRKKVLEVAKYLKISHRLTHYPSELSGGEKQRVAIARALVREAEVLILDEPFVRLDYKVREDMRAELYRLQKDLGINVIIITSDPADAMAFTEHIAFMMNGRIIQTGSLSELYENPSDISVAKYIGSVEMNVISANMVQEGSRPSLEIVNNKVPIKRTIDLAENRVLIGIRPEQLYIVDRPRGGERELTIDGRIKITEVVGSDTIVHMDIGLNETIRVIVPTIYRRAPGEKITVAFNMEDIYVFTNDGKFLCRGKDLLG